MQTSPDLESVPSGLQREALKPAIQSFFEKTEACKSLSKLARAYSLTQVPKVSHSDQFIIPLICKKNILQNKILFK